MPKVVLDSTPLHLITQKEGISIVDACRAWVESLMLSGVRVIVPEIADYEVRRDLLQGRKAVNVVRLDAFKFAQSDRYLPITTEAMLRAAELWAMVRQGGVPTAAPHALDGDVILAAQTLTLHLPPEEVVIATANVSHLSRLTVPAVFWQDVAPF